MQDSEEMHEIPARVLLSSAEGIEPGTIDHRVPFHCRISGSSTEEVFTA
jgi:hypothetical protein